MNTKIKGFLADVVRAGGIVAAILAIILASAPSLNVPAQWVVYVSVAAGFVNGIVGLLRPYAAATVASIRGK